MTNINGFVFNAIGELIGQPEHISIELLNDTLKVLYKQQEYIKASRIQGLINTLES